MVPAPIGPSVGRAINNLDAAISEIGAIVTMTGDMPIVRIDDNEITRLFQNLIGNAIKYRAPGTTPEIRVSVQREGDHWVFDVTDNGIGIDPKHFERIFGVFQRLHTQDQYEGTGIGLAVCRRVVERHGGRIWVDSAPARGSIFHVALPAIDAENEAADAPPAVSPA
jgi:light-regulated signal transduction histidine kinase (bacteriophytochrome)